MKSQLIGTSDTLRVANGNFNGVNLMLNLEAAAVNTALVTGDVDYSKILIRVTYHCEGQEYEVIPNLSLRTLNSLLYDTPFFLGARDWTTNRDILQVSAAAVKEVSVAYIFIPFGDTFNLGNAASMNIEVNARSGFSANIGANSTIQFDCQESIGIQDGITFIQNYQMQAALGQQQVSSDLAITDAVFVNYDKTDVLTANNVVTSVTLTSDKYKQQWNNLELLNDKAKSFQTIASAQARIQSYKILQTNVPVLSFQTDFSFETANLTASNNEMIIVGKRFTNKVMKRRFNTIKRVAEKTENKMDAILGFPSGFDSAEPYQKTSMRDLRSTLKRGSMNSSYNKRV